jgi:hypothetical protein
MDPPEDEPVRSLPDAALPPRARPEPAEPPPARPDAGAPEAAVVISETPDAGSPDATDGADVLPPSRDGAPVADASLPVAAVRCGDPALWVCDDFEKGTEGMPPGTPWGARGGRAVVSTAKANSGAKSIVTRKGQALRFSFPAGMRPDVIWGRVMFWADDTPNEHWSFIMAERREGHMFRLGQQRRYDKQLMTNYGWPPGGEREMISRERFPLRTWACFEWHFDRVMKVSELWVNGKLITAASGKVTFGPAIPGPWEWVDIGQSTFHAEAGNPVIYIDDVAMGPKRIGCPATGAP